MLGETEMSHLKHRTGSNNVFADIGITDAPEYLVKSDLARKIVATIRKRGLTQSSAAQRLGIDQPKVSALMRGLLTGFSTDRLLRFIASLGAEVEIVVHDSPTRTATVVGLPRQRTEYMAFAASANSSKGNSLLISTSTANEDWRLAASLVVQQNTINQILTLPNAGLE